jgi:hypothetical protein
MGYIAWGIRLMVRGMTPWTAYRFIRTMKIARTGFGFIDRRHPVTKRIKKAWMYLKLVVNGMNPFFAFRVASVCTGQQMVFADRRRF